MNLLYALLATLLTYPLIGTLLFSWVERINFSITMKVIIVTFGHPLLTGIFVWLVCSIFSQEIANTAIAIIAGTLLRIPFSDRKYLTSFVEESEIVTIGYISESLKIKTIQLSLSEIKNFAFSKSSRLIDKPLSLTMVLSSQTLTFTIVDKNIKPSLQ